MGSLFRTSRVWVLEFTYDGRSRIWFKAFPEGLDVRAEVAALLEDLYGQRAQLVSVRPATEKEDLDFIRGNLPKNQLCPTGRAPLTRPRKE
jgi:hypothetical protein